ncbi:MAG: alpha-L-arabinofuranosidase C-terminal domain-containing protein [Mycobacteriales bacterium]
MGRCVYGGIYDPSSQYADGDGFRKDVIALVQEMGVTIVRYPGGNFLSGYDWKDGVGPVESRPQRLDLAWHSLESNEFGLDEFMKWSKIAGIEPMMANNLGTGTLKDALQLLEYCNSDAPSAMAAYRAQNGNSEPHGVKVWCLGNEMDGPWQLGHKSGDDYGKLAADVARGMRQMDPDVELVACGSSHRQMPTFGAWEEQVLDHTYDLVDHVSMHAYYENNYDDLQSFLVSSTDLDAFITDICAVADSVKARKRSDKVITFSLDEWNVWYLSRIQKILPLPTWEKGPALSEDDYTVADAVVVGNLLVSVLRRADRVKMACLAQLVNTIGTIRAEAGGEAWRQTSFYPFSLTARHARGESLVTRVVSPTLQTGKFGEVDAIDAIATVDDKAKEAAFFLVNRSAGDTIDVTLDLRGFAGFEVLEHVVLSDPDPLRTNTVAEPTAVTPTTQECSAEGAAISLTLPPVSWNMVRVKLA